MCPACGSHPPVAVRTGKAELNLEEVLRLTKMVGFELESSDLAGQSNDDASAPLRARRSIECEYTADKTAMMAWIYTAEFWVATKPKQA